MKDLNIQARNYLKQLLNKPMSEDRFRRKKSTTVQIIIDWCQQFEFEAGQTFGDAQYVFTRKHIHKIADTLLEYNFPDIYYDFSDKNRAEVAKVSSNEKLAKIKPKDNIVLVALTDQSSIQPIINTYYSADNLIANEQLNIELTVNSLNLSHFSQLIVIENRDSFNDWSRYLPFCPMDIQQKNPLVVYRGDNENDSVGCKMLRRRWQQEKINAPLIYFGDFDPKGLEIPISDKYNTLLLPHLDYLTAHLVEEHFPDGQQCFIPRLKSDCFEPWYALLTLLITKKAGLRQQLMFDTPLTLYVA